MQKVGLHLSARSASDGSPLETKVFLSFFGFLGGRLEYLSYYLVFSSLTQARAGIEKVITWIEQIPVHELARPRLERSKEQGARIRQSALSQVTEQVM